MSESRYTHLNNFIHNRVLLLNIQVVIYSIRNGGCDVLLSNIIGLIVFLGIAVFFPEEIRYQWKSIGI